MDNKCAGDEAGMRCLGFEAGRHAREETQKKPK